MRRRNLLQFASILLPISAVTQSAEAAEPRASKVVYHLDDLDKVGSVLGNIRNHYDGMGGPENVTIALVVHGPALKAFHAAGASPASTQDLAALKLSGLEAYSCINTMHAQNVTLKDLMPGFVVADKGGVVKLADLQAQGYAYLRP
ncbi:MAG: DsrE family protein [Xanthobacteraceae bacterium]